MVKTLSSNAGGVGSIPGLRTEVPHARVTAKRKKNHPGIDIYTTMNKIDN